ncbi:MAG: hypothetical protein LWY06_05800 [Firmicutes bacterium]|nr:hypothetical protein [Bacillota bacterium]
MINYYETIDEELKGKLEQKLNVTGTDPSVLGETAHYFFSLAKMMDGIRLGYVMWLDKEAEKHVDTREFFVGTLGILKLVKKLLDSMDGIVGTYISGMDVPAEFSSRESQAWHYQGNSRNYKQMTGIFPALIKSGLTQDFIDRYYLDGTLLEVYEECTELIPAIAGLGEMRAISPIELREGIFLIENRFRNLYAKLFIERFENALGLAGVLNAALHTMPAA